MTQADASTPDQLAAAAMALFARRGFEATSTRAIAARAGANISSIAYHFGGKEGLRLACADRLAESLAQAARVMPAAGDHAAPADLSPQAARQVLRRLLRRIVTLLTFAPAAGDVAGFLLRELADPASPVLDRLYAGEIAPRHSALCRIWAAATGRPSAAEAEDTRLAVFSLIGQAAYFRLAAPLVQRRMGWTGYGRPQARAILRRLLVNLDAMLETG